MDQAQLQRGLDEQSADQFKVIPEEEMEGQRRTPSSGESDGHVDEGHGHGKRSMLNKMKDKAKTLKTKVKKKMTPHHGGTHEENHSESTQNSQEATSEEEEGEEDVEEHHQAGEKTDVENSFSGLDSFGAQPVLRDDSQSSVQHIIAEKFPDISSNKEEMSTEETLNLKRGGITAEAPEPSLGLGNIHQIQEQRQEEKPIGTTRFGESIPVKDIEDDGREEFKSAENNFQTGGFNSEATKSSLGLGKIHEMHEQGEEEKPISTRFGESIPHTDVDDYGRGDKSSLGLGKIHQMHEQAEEEKPISSRFGESIPHTDVDDYGRGDKSMEDNFGDKSMEDNFQTTPENEEPGKAWNQSSSEGGDRGKENFEEFGVYKDTSSPQMLREEQFQSPEGKVNDNVKDTPEKAELGKSWSERASEGLGFAKEKLQGYGVISGRKSAEKPKEEPQSSVGHVQDKVNEIGERNEMGSNIKSPTNTEEMKNGPSETGSGYVKEASMLAEEFKKVFSFDQTKSSDKSKDADIEGEKKENKENADEGILQQQRGEGKESQGYVTKIYSAKDAISSKLGFGGQTNQEPNVREETKPDDQLQGKEMDIDKQSPGYTEEIRNVPSEKGSGYVREETKPDDQIQGKKVDIDKQSPSYTEEIKNGPSEKGSGYVKEASKLAEELKKVLSFDQTSSTDKAKDTRTEGVNKEHGDEGTQQQLSGGEGTAGQSYVSKIYSAKDAISSKFGYGGQTNQEANVIAESKSADQIPRTATESMEGAKESKETLKSSIISKFSPGEDDKALSEVITGAVSNSAKSLKDSIGGLYGGNGKVSTTEANMAASEINSQSTASNPSGGKGIVDRVTGVVGSFFGNKQGDNSEQHSASGKLEPKSEVQVQEQVPEVPKY